MNDKKNIDRLFQEKFKDFDIIPDEIVWEKIKAHQNKNKKRGLLLPFWYKVAGVAALVAVIFGIGYLSFNNNSQSQQDSTLTNSDTENTTKKASDKYLEPRTTSREIVTTSEKEIKEPENINADHKKEPTIIKENTVAKATEKSKKQASEKEKNQSLFASDPIANKDQFVNHKTQNLNSNLTKNNNSQSKENNVVFNPDKKIEKRAIANNQNQDSNSGKEYSSFTTPDKKDRVDPQRLAENNFDKTNKETTPKEPLKDLNNAGKKSIFDAITQGEEVVIEESTKAKKWNISPNIAPVYYNTIGNGSSIDKQFADNNKDGQINMSYGVQVSYTINNKLSVRSGVHKVDLSYNTEDIGFVPSAIGQNLENVDYNTTAGAILISDIGKSPSSSEFSEISRNAVNRTQNPGLLNQSIDYIEVPLEMKYALIDKKIGINMIGGISTLFLQNNEVSIEAGDFETPIGSVNNLNDISFSGNIGLGVDYQLSDYLEVNLEPIFKYQFNAVNSNANSFRPYYFGVYTGISIKF